MSTAVDFEQKAVLVATKTAQTHLAKRGGSSVYLKPADWTCHALVPPQVLV